MYSQEPVSDIVRSTVDTALRIHFDEGGASSIGDGDILCFLPSGEDIDRALAMAEDILPSMNASAGGKARRDVVFLPLYGSLPYQMQARVFQPRRAGDDSRRVIFATNIAETSVTVPNIASVIDAGFAKLPHFDADTGFDRLITCPISRASARQRAGRAGRIRAGKCYRLYTERDMAEKMEATTQPEVLRTNLTSFILTLKAMGVDNILSFDLMSIPSVAALSHGLECLYALEAIDRDTNLTHRGNQMAEFPTEPRVSTMLLESLGAGCAEEALAVAASLQVRALFHQPRTERQQIEYDAAMPEIADRSGDHVTHVNLLELFQRAPLSAEECRERFINRVALKRALEVKAQLRRFLRRYGSINGMENALDEDRSKSIRKCVTSGFFFNTAKLGSDGRYYTLRGRHMVSISKASVLDRYGESTEYIIFCETYDGSRGGIEVRNCSAAEGRWLRELAPHYWAS
jgi:ATP-dependent RNA helicase DDX35